MKIERESTLGRLIQSLSRSVTPKAWPILVPLLLVSCTSTVVTPPPPVYIPPAPRASAIFELISNSNFDATWSALVRHTASTSFSIDEFERASGLMTLSFSPADPATMVECGQWQESGKPPMPYVESTGMVLQTRTNLIVQPINEFQTGVRVNTLYILEDGSGNVYQFTTNQSATVQPRNRSIGTTRTRTCQSTHDGEKSFVAGVRQALR